MFSIDSLYPCAAASATCSFSCTSFLHITSIQLFLSGCWQLLNLRIMQHVIWWVGGWVGGRCLMKKSDSWFPVCWSICLDFKTGHQETHLRSVGPPTTWLSLPYWLSLTKNIDMETQSTDFLNILQIIRIFNGYVTLTAVVGQLSRALKFVIWCLCHSGCCAWCHWGFLVIFWGKQLIPQVDDSAQSAVIIAVWRLCQT